MNDEYQPASSAAPEMAPDLTVVGVGSPPEGELFPFNVACSDGNSYPCGVVGIKPGAKVTIVAGHAALLFDQPVDSPHAIPSATPEGDQGPADVSEGTFAEGGPILAAAAGLADVLAKVDDLLGANPKHDAFQAQVNTILAAYAPQAQVDIPLIRRMEDALALPVVTADEGTPIESADPRTIVAFKDEQRRTFHVVVMPDGTLAARPFVRA